jgi:hypothetical protein
MFRGMQRAKILSSLVLRTSSRERLARRSLPAEAAREASECDGGRDP